MSELTVNNRLIGLNSSDYHVMERPSAYNDTNIFGVNADRKRTLSDKNVEILQEQLEAVKNRNGCFLTLWNGIKNETGFGVTDARCNEVIEQYKKGKITFEEADRQIKEYSLKQDESLNLHSNIFASVAALAATAVAASTFGVAGPLALIAIGAATGGIAKAGFKLADRASNKIDDDALDARQIAKDGLSGAVTGAIATYTMGTASSASTIKSAITNCGITGVKAGAAASSANYTIDCALDENKKFKAMELAETTAEGAVVGGTVGAFMGGFNFTLHTTPLLKSGCSFDKFVLNKGTTSRDDVVANSVCTSEYKVVTDRLKSIYS